MRKPLTGEPYAGELHVRFGGRGGVSLPYPYQRPCDAARRSYTRPPHWSLRMSHPDFIECYPNALDPLLCAAVIEQFE